MALSWTKGRATSEIERRFLICKASLLQVSGFLGDKLRIALARMKANARDQIEGASRALLLAAIELCLLGDRSLAVLASTKAQAGAGIERASDLYKAWLPPIFVRIFHENKPPAVHSRPKGRGRTEVERAFNLCKASLLMILVLSFFVNLLALTVPLYLLHIYDYVLSSRSIETLVMLTLIVIVASGRAHNPRGPAPRDARPYRRLAR